MHPPRRTPATLHHQRLEIRDPGPRLYPPGTARFRRCTSKPVTVGSRLRFCLIVQEDARTWSRNQKYAQRHRHNLWSHHRFGLALHFARTSRTLWSFAEARGPGRKNSVADCRLGLGSRRRQKSERPHFATSAEQKSPGTAGLSPFQHPEEHERTPQSYHRLRELPAIAEH